MSGRNRHIPILALAALVLMTGAARAETNLSLAIGDTVIDVTRTDITGLQRGERGTLYIRLAPVFDARIAALTADHVGSTVILSVCGEKVMEATLQSPLTTATFVIADPDPSRLSSIESRLRAADCPGG